MANKNGARDNVSIEYLNATEKHIETLTTVVPRSFTQNERIQNSLPDTPAMRQWWAQVFADLINDPHSRIPIAVDTSTGLVVGAITAHGVPKGQPFGGFMIHHPQVEDHGEDWPELVQGFTEREERTIGDQNRILIEIMGIDEAYQGRRIGSKLVAETCKFADEKGWPIFLETSMARHFYLRQGLGFKLFSTDEGEEGNGGQILRAPFGKEDE